MPWAPVGAVLALVVAYGSVFFTVPWPYTDVYGVLDEATRWNWLHYLGYAFGADVEYRPLFTLSVKAVHQVVGFRLTFYQAVVMAQFAAALGLLVWLCRPCGPRRAMAAVLALACVCGLHTTRILFGFWPLNHHSAGLVLLLGAVALACSRRTLSFDWIFLPLTLVALLVLESGVVILPVLIALWWARAPGMSVKGVVAATAAVALYAATRVALSGTGASLGVHAESGFGFAELSAAELQSTFGGAPWLFWAYNVLATFLTIVASEPRAGIYRFVESLLHGSVPAWRWLHVGSSLLTTALIVAGTATRPAAGRDRFLLVSGVTLVAAGSMLGFLYTRDRIGLTGGVGYGLLLYVAAAQLLEGMPAGGWRRRVAGGAVAFVAAAWTVRSVETYFQIRDSAWEFREEWVARDAEIAGRPQTETLTLLQTAALGSTPADPRRDPAWAYVWFERRFGRDMASASHDEALTPSGGGR